METFLRNQNIKKYRELLGTARNEEQRQQIKYMLEEEEAKIVPSEPKPTIQ